MASTSLTDSEAAFRKQSGNLGLHQDWIDGLIAVGVSNLGRLAFACGQPGAPTQDVDVTNLLTSTGVVRVISVGDIAIMKRLIFEAQTSVISLVRSQADPNSDPSVRKLPAAERTARVAAQKARLAGLNLEGPLEVAHCVYDLVSGMLEADSLKYVAPNRCVTRLSEITSTKPPKELKLDSNSTGIVVREGQNDQTCPTTSELDISEAMTRRSLAFDAVGLIQYEVFQRWVGYMFQLLRQAPPPGFNAPTITQLLRTDRQAFVRRWQEMESSPFQRVTGLWMPWWGTSRRTTMSSTTCCRHQWPRKSLQRSLQRTRAMIPRRMEKKRIGGSSGRPSSHGRNLGQVVCQRPWRAALPLPVTVRGYALLIISMAATKHNQENVVTRGTTFALPKTAGENTLTTAATTRSDMDRAPSRGRNRRPQVCLPIPAWSHWTALKVHRRIQ